MNRNYAISAFILGLLAALWVAYGYIGGSLLALSVTLIIITVYTVGGLEMRRYHRQTQALTQALQALPDQLAELGPWLQQLPGALQNAVRLRIEGERVPLPGPSITPYLVGLLVLLGMLGTFLGMVVTLNGAVLALESTTDLHTIRAALAAPVKGLGVAFGTSVAGVATSAMLGLVSALCRRDRLKAGQLLDSRIAGVLRGFSLNHQRQTTFTALQNQAQALPELVGKLDTLMQQMADNQRQLSERLLANQAAFHAETQARYGELAQSVGQSLQASVKDSATVAANAIQPVVTATMAGIANETRSLHDQLSGTVQSQLAGIASQFAQTVNQIGETWAQTLAHHETNSDSQREQLQAALSRYAETFEQRASALLGSVESTQTRQQAAAAEQQAQFAATASRQQQDLATTLATQLDGITQRLDQAVANIADSWQDALTQHTQGSAALNQQLHASLGSFTETFNDRSQTLLAAVEGSHARLSETASSSQQQLATTLTGQIDTLTQRLDEAVTQVADTWQAALAQHAQSSSQANQALHGTLTAFGDTFGQRSEALLASVATTHAELKAELATSHAAFAQTSQQQQSALAAQIASQLEGISQRFDSAVSQVASTWQQALSSHEQASDRLTRTLDQTQHSLAESFSQRSASLLAELRATQADWQRDWAAGEHARQQQFTSALGDLADKLENQWQAHGAANQAQQAEITRNLAETTEALVIATRQQAETTIAEVTRLMQTAAEAPKAAAEVIGQLRQALSASVARDNTLLEERARIMQTLGALLDAINHASTEQRSAIDALVASSATLLERTSEQFAARLAQETGKLSEIGTGIAGGALEVASLGDTFGVAVKLFAESSDKMMSTLQRIEGALAKSLTRSDEQLAYYVAQAREIIDLSILSQKKMVDDLQRVASQRDEA